MSENQRDRARQVLTIIGAVFQIAAGAWSGERVGNLANELWTPILPAGYAFFIWTPIFLLSLAYAVWQVLPANRTRAVPRAVGWPLALAFIGNGLWEVFFPLGQYVLAQVVIIGIWVLLALTLGQVLALRADWAPAEQWLIALTIGLYFGWITAAMCAGMAMTLTAFDLGTGPVAAVVTGMVLLVIGAALAAVVMVRGQRAPRPLLIGYAGAVIWAVVAIAVKQLRESPVTGGFAVVVGVVVLALLVWLLARPGGRAPRLVSRPTRMAS